MKYVTAAINAGLDLHRNEISSGLMADELIQGWLDFALWAIETWEKCDRFLDQWQSLADETRELTARWLAPVLPIVGAIAFWLFITAARAFGWCWGHTKRWWWMAWENAISDAQVLYFPDRMPATFGAKPFIRGGSTLDQIFILLAPLFHSQGLRAKLFCVAFPQVLK